MVENGVAEQDFHFSCLRWHMPRNAPMKDARGLSTCDPQTLVRWQLDDWVQGPYQYRPQKMVVSTRTKELRRLISVESERLVGYPSKYTSAVPTSGLDAQEAEWRRLSLLGNACLAAEMVYAKTTETWGCGKLCAWGGGRTIN